MARKTTKPSEEPVKAEIPQTDSEANQNPLDPGQNSDPDEQKAGSLQTGFDATKNSLEDGPEGALSNADASQNKPLPQTGFETTERVAENGSEGTSANTGEPPDKPLPQTGFDETENDPGQQEDDSENTMATADGAQDAALLKTGSNSPGGSPEGALSNAGSSQNTPLPQTGFGADQNHMHINQNSDPDEQKAGSLQTGFDATKNSPEDGPEGALSNAGGSQNKPFPQTGFDANQNHMHINQNPDPDEQNLGSLQTGIDKTKNSPEDGPEGALSNEGAPQDAALTKPDLESNYALAALGKKTASKTQSDSEENLPAGEAKPKRTTRRKPKNTPVVSIDEQRSVQTHADKLKDDLLDLIESQKGRKILTGTIQGVERSAETPENSFAVIYHGEFKVIIPVEQLVEPPQDFRDRALGDVMHYLVTKRLGAEVDYIVKGVDVKSGIAAASRLEAMAQKRRDYYFGTDREGNYQLYEGVNAEARVVSVIRAGIFADLFGVEIYIPLKELSYQRWLDASQYFQPGQRVLVKILGIDRSDRTKLKVTASVKQASENPYEKALKKYSIGSRYVGTVSMVDTNGVFVSLDGSIDCLCSYPKRGRPPRGSRVTVRVLGINHDSNRIWGAITHMTAPR